MKINSFSNSIPKVIRSPGVFYVFWLLYYVCNVGWTSYSFFGNPKCYIRVLRVQEKCLSSQCDYVDHKSMILFPIRQLRFHSREDCFSCATRRKSQQVCGTGLSMLMRPKSDMIHTCMTDTVQVHHYATDVDILPPNFISWMTEALEKRGVYTLMNSSTGLHSM